MISKAIETWSERIQCGGTLRFFAIPWETGSVYVFDEEGKAYGSYFTAENFKKSKKSGDVNVICRVAVSFRVIREGEG